MTFHEKKKSSRSNLTTVMNFGGWCRETKESFMYAVHDRSAATLLPIIQNSIRPGITIHIIYLTIMVEMLKWASISLQ